MSQTQKTVKSATYGPLQILSRTGLAAWQLERALELGIVADKAAGRWTEAEATAIAAARGRIAEQVGERYPAGAGKCAGLLAEVTGLAVAPADVLELSGLGLLPVVGAYKRFPLYDMNIAARWSDVELLAGIVARREAWMAASLDEFQAADRLGWRVGELRRVVRERATPRGQFDRFAVADIDALAGDRQLGEDVRRERLLTFPQAAGHFSIRRRDLKYAEAAGWISPAAYKTIPVGAVKTVHAALYRTADVEDLALVPGIDWERVRAVAPGRPSVLREFARLPVERATAVRAFANRLAERFGAETFAWWWNAGDTWLVDWLTSGGQPTSAQVRTFAAEDAGWASVEGSASLGTFRGRGTREARSWCEPGRAVIVDTETTSLSGSICEVAVIAAHDGSVLLDTLVNTGGVSITDGARAVHGLTDSLLESAPTWPEIWPRFEAAVGDATVLAYNSGFDHGRVRHDCSRYGIDMGMLRDADRWRCLMKARSAFLGLQRRLPLGGGHRARGDCEAAREVVLSIAFPNNVVRAPAFGTGG
jgi:DNA polymerase III epsilon subunit-like protein